jgi:hypothetical protein
VGGAYTQKKAGNNADAPANKWQMNLTRTGGAKVDAHLPAGITFARGLCVHLALAHVAVTTDVVEVAHLCHNGNCVNKAHLCLQDHSVQVNAGMGCAGPPWCAHAPACACAGDSLVWEVRRAAEARSASAIAGRARGHDDTPGRPPPPRPL